MDEDFKDNSKLKNDDKKDELTNNKSLPTKEQENNQKTDSNNIKEKE